MNVHVVPVGDLFPHDETGTDCPCHPRIERYEGNWLVIHYAWDQREQLEEPLVGGTITPGGRA